MVCKFILIYITLFNFLLLDSSDLKSSSDYTTESSDNNATSESSNQDNGMNTFYLF